jgi:hypothetical protein
MAQAMLLLVVLWSKSGITGGLAYKAGCDWVRAIYTVIL